MAETIGFSPIALTQPPPLSRFAALFRRFATSTTTWAEVSSGSPRTCNSRSRSRGRLGRERRMANELGVTLEVGPKDKKVVAVAPDWPGLERGGPPARPRFKRYSPTSHATQGWRSWLGWMQSFQPSRTSCSQRHGLSPRSRLAATYPSGLVAATGNGGHDRAIGSRQLGPIDLAA